MPIASLGVNMPPVAKENQSVILATGGSGEHIYPAIAVAQALKDQGYDPIFIGQAKGMEADIVPHEGFGFYGVRAGKWHRDKPLSLPAQGFKALLGLYDSYRLLKKLETCGGLGFWGVLPVSSVGRR
ncbi:MAG: glycosyltransferase [Deinococcales bacterium]